MANSHNSSDGTDRSIGKPMTRTRRRSFLAVAGAGALTGSLVGTSRGDPSEVDLAAKGLKDGSNIDPFLEKHFQDGRRIRIPAGDYRSKFTWWSTTVEDAQIVGDPEGVRFHRPEGLQFEENGDDYKIHEYMRFDGHVVIENITIENKHGWQQNRIDVEGMSDDAHLELRNVNHPDGSVGHGDSLFSRAYGSGRVDYKWCHLEEYANSAFYQLSTGRNIRQVFDGCVFRNSTNIHRGGTRDYTIRNCLYISDDQAPEFCEEETAPCTGDAWGGLQRPFKFDLGYSWSGQFENLHFLVDHDDAGFMMDFQEEQPDLAVDMDGLYITNNTDQTLFRFEWDAEETCSATNVHLTGDGDLDVPDWFETVDDPDEPITEFQTWTPCGRGNPLVDAEPLPGESRRPCSS